MIILPTMVVKRKEVIGANLRVGFWYNGTYRVRESCMNEEKNRWKFSKDAAASLFFKSI